MKKLFELLMAHIPKIPQIIDFFFKHLRRLSIGLAFLLMLTISTIFLYMIIYFTYSITGNMFFSILPFTLGSYFIGKALEYDLH